MQTYHVPYSWSVPEHSFEVDFEQLQVHPPEEARVILEAFKAGVRPEVANGVYSSRGDKDKDRIVARLADAHFIMTFLSAAGQAETVEDFDWRIAALLHNTETKATYAFIKEWNQEVRVESSFRQLLTFCETHPELEEAAISSWALRLKSATGTRNKEKWQAVDRLERLKVDPNDRTAKDSKSKGPPISTKDRILLAAIKLVAFNDLARLTEQQRSTDFAALVTQLGDRGIHDLPLRSFLRLEVLLDEEVYENLSWDADDILMHSWDLVIGITRAGNIRSQTLQLSDLLKKLRAGDGRLHGSALLDRATVTRIGNSNLVLGAVNKLLASNRRPTKDAIADNDKRAEVKAIDRILLLAINDPLFKTEAQALTHARCKIVSRAAQKLARKGVAIKYGVWAPPKTSDILIKYGSSVSRYVRQE